MARDDVESPSDSRRSRPGSGICCSSGWNGDAALQRGTVGVANEWFMLERVV